MLKSIFTLLGNKGDPDIRTNDTLFRLLFRYSPLSIEIYDRTGLQLDVNPAYEKLWKVYSESTVGSYNILEDDRLFGTQLHSCILDVYRNEYTVSIKHDLKLPSVVPGNGRRKVKTTIIPVKDDHGELDQVMILHQDLVQQELPALLSVAS